MRAFNEREKEILKGLVDRKDNHKFSMENFITKSIYPLKKSEGLYFDIENKNLYLLLPKEENSKNSRKRVRESKNEFYEFLSLIIYLKENRWISVFYSPKHPCYYDDHYLVLGETFQTLLKDGIKISYPPETPDESYNGPTIFTNEQETHISWELGSSLYSLAGKYFLDDIFISEDLKELVNNNFATREEKRHKEQIRVARRGIRVAIVALLLQ